MAHFAPLGSVVLILLTSDRIKKKAVEPRRAGDESEAP